MMYTIGWPGPAGGDASADSAGRLHRFGAGVDSSALHAVDLEVHGPRIAAFVVPRKGLEGIDFQSLESHARAGVATYKVPREWHVVDSLPRNPSGKILKRDIRANHESTSSER